MLISICMNFLKRGAAHLSGFTPHSILNTLLDAIGLMFVE